MKFIIQLIVVFYSLSNPAYAYLDPGIGSVILQAIIAGIAVAMTVVSIYWQKFKKIFGIGKKKTEEKNDKTP